MEPKDFVKLTHGPYGTRWSYSYDPECDTPPSVRAVEKLLGVKLADTVLEGEGEETEDGEFLAEAVYVAADDYDDNTVATYQVQ